MTSPNRKPICAFHPSPAPVPTGRMVWDESQGKLVSAPPVLRGGQFISDARQVKKYLKGQYHQCHVERTDDLRR